MIEEADSVGPDRTIQCDICIIGGGAAGITLAAEFAGSPQSVVLLESGGTVLEEATQKLYEGELVGSPQFPLETSRLRFLGGTTNHWAGMCRPFDAFDFDVRPWVPHSGWPIALEDLEPYYVRAHEVCDLGPYDYGEGSWPGVTAPGPRLAAETDVELKLVQHSKPTRFAKKYAELLRRPDGPRVILHANALELVPDAAVKTIQRLRVGSLSGHRFTVSARRYVLATGAVENARLLLLSNGVSRRGLGNAHDLVGRFFMDHPAAAPFAVLLFFDPAYHRLAEKRVINGVRVWTGLALRPEALERRGLLSNAVYMQGPMTPEAVRDFEWRNIVQTVGNTLDNEDMEIINFLESLSPERKGAKAALCWIRSEQAPNPDSRVMLSDKLDALGQRRVVLDWRLAELNHKTFVEAAEIYSGVFARSQIGRMKLMPWLLDGDEQWWRKVTPGWHHIGTTRMAAAPEHGVVDSDCRVFGLDNLFVAGSSVFPTSSYINPTLTIVALAIRLGDHLRR